MPKLLLYLFVCFPFACFPQSPSSLDYYIPSKKVDSIPYSKDFIFEEGIYLTSKDFVSNSPINKERILIDYQKNQPDFLEQVMVLISFKYINSKGDTVKALKNNIWGYCLKNFIYVRTTEGFSRMAFAGSICYVIANFQSKKVISNENSSTHATPDPQLPLVNLQNKYLGDGHFFWDAQDRKTIEFDSYAIKSFLKKRDQSLYKEFIALPRKKQKYASLIFVKKYNEKHPLYLPVK